MEKLELNVLGNQQQLEVRTGTALPLREPKVIDVRGDINTITSFLSKRKREAGHSSQGVFEEKSIVYTDVLKRTMKIDIDPENPYGGSVYGTLLITDELRQFSINETKQFNREQLVKLLRFNKRYFKSQEVHLNILTSYQSFKASSKSEHETSSDTRGNKANHFVKQVETTLPTGFVLSMSIFKGQPVETFMVEICLELTDAGAHFWFESPELEELISIRTEQIFQEQLKSCEGLVVVNV